MQIKVLLLASVAFGRVLHQHHAHKRDLATQYVTQYVTTVTVPSTASSSSSSVSGAVASASSSISSSAVPSSFVTSVSSAATASASSGSSAVASSAASAAATPGASSASTGSGTFQDGTIACSSFPSGVAGVVARPDLGLGGWIGIQSGNSQGSSCTEGSYCSYACTPGQLKTQWPSTQPSDGQSRGGLLCQGGYLYRTQTSTNALCEAGAPTAQIQNNVGQTVVVCQTDYPGTENMVIPTSTDGSIAVQPLAVPYANSYYQHDGSPTSAQYYVQAAGISASQGCVWGSAGSNLGNFSPLNFGAGVGADGNTYLSLIPNPQGSLSGLNYNVKIQANPGGSINGNCAVENGQYVGGSGSDGCTVTVTSGTASFVLY